MKGRSSFENLAKKLPPIIARDHVEALLGGVISAKRLADLDSLEQGPNRIRIGREVAYDLLRHAQASQYEPALKQGIISYYSRDGPLARYSSGQDLIVTTRCVKSNRKPFSVGLDAPHKLNRGVPMAFHEKNQIVGWWCEISALVVCKECMDDGTCCECAWFPQLEPVDDLADGEWIVTCAKCHKHIVE